MYLYKNTTYNNTGTYNNRCTNYNRGTNYNKGTYNNTGTDTCAPTLLYLMGFSMSI